MGNTCKHMAVSFQCMTKSTTHTQKKNVKKKKEKKEAERYECSREDTRPKMNSEVGGESLLRDAMQYKLRTIVKQQRERWEKTLNSEQWEPNGSREYQFSDVWRLLKGHLLLESRV